MALDPKWFAEQSNEKLQEIVVAYRSETPEHKRAAAEIHRREKRERELRDQQRHQELVSSQKPKARSKDIAQDENSERPNCRRIGT